jgi:hypothetical protein
LRGRGGSDAGYDFAVNPQQPCPPQFPNGYQPQPPRKKSKAWWIVLLALSPFVICIVGLVAGAVGGAFSGGDDSAGAPSTNATGTPVAPRVTTVRPAIACESAPPGVVGYLNASLSNQGYSLANAQQVTRAENGDQYVGGDIMQGDRRISSSDVWLVRGGVTYALSSDARKLSGVGDGRDLPGPKPAMSVGPSAGDDWGFGVQECVNTARRGR